MNSRAVSFEGKQVYIGIDVHKSFFVASCLCEGVLVKRCRMPARAAAVISLVERYFPDSEVKSCYEAGFSGFWLHRKLTQAGISNIVVHAASVEISAHDRVKTDKRDSLKLAKQLSVGRLTGIRVPSLEQEQARVLTRTREQLMSAKRRVQTQIRMRLHQFGTLPEGYQGALRLKDVRALSETLDVDLKLSVECMCAQWENLLNQVKRLEQHLKQQAKHDPLEAVYRSVPGIGALSARILSNELGDMSQFPNERSLFNFTGLTPAEYSSGTNIHRGHISRAGSSRLRHVLVEAAWVAIKRDVALKQFFDKISVRRGKKRAIVAVARKLIGRIRAILKNSQPYVTQHSKEA